MAILDQVAAMTEALDQFLAGPDREKIVREIKTTMDEIVWRSLSLGSSILKQYELTLQQALILGAITRLGPDVEMGQVAEATLLAPSTTTSVVDRLLQRGLVSRTPHPTDRRRVLVSATRAGDYLVQEMDEQDVQAFQWMSRSLRTEDLDVIRTSFRHLLEQLELMKPEDFGRGKSVPASRKLSSSGL
jgi:DNA-binding MarR family transcriptional regulator